MKSDVKNLNKTLVSGNNLKGVVSVDLGLFQNSGSSIIQQLAYSLSHANEYLNLLNINNTVVFYPNSGKSSASFAKSNCFGGSTFVFFLKLK